MSVKLSPKLLEQLESLANAHHTSVEDVLKQAIDALPSATSPPKRAILQTISTEHFNLAAKAARLGVWTLDLQTNHLEWNDEQLNIYGITRHQFEHDLESWQHVVHPDDREYAEKRLEDAMAGKTVIDVEFRIVRQDGSIRYISGAATPIADDEGNIVKVIGNNLDITHHKRTQQSLTHQATVLKYVNDAVIITDPDFYIISWNEKAADIYGWRAEEAIGMRVGEIIPTHQYLDGTTADSARAQLLADGHWSGEVMQSTRDGTQLYVFASITLIKDDDGQIRGSVAINRDITAKKRADQLEQERQQLTAQLQQEKYLSEMRTKMLATIAHEFRTPLAIILSSSEILVKYGHRLSEEKKVKATAKIGQQIRHLSTMIDELTMFSEADNGVLVPDFKQVNLHHYCTEVMADLRALMRDKQQLTFNNAVDDDTIATFDPHMMRMMLTNLVVNAIKYSPDGGKITVELTDHENNWMFNIADEGIGIPVSEQSQVFDPFFRASNVNHVRGSGVGLSLVREMVDKHHGTITFESTEGDGATFILCIPQALGEAIHHEDDSRH